MDKKKEKIITLKAVGDIMLSRDVGRVIKEKGPKFPFLHIAAKLKGADIVFGNFESPISNRGERIKRFQHLKFRADPRVIEGLIYSGFNVLSLANNHVFDYGSEAFSDTLRILNKNQIKFIGAGINEHQAKRPLILKIKGAKIAILAYSSFFDSSTFVANREKPGIASIKSVKRDITEIRKDVDFIIVSIHWGIEYCEYPVPLESEMAREIIEFGADLILGHHPHVIQGIENHRSGVIVYSLGNFVFDEPFKESRETFIFECRFSKEGIKETNLIPVIINRVYQPEIARGEKKLEIISEINRLSSDYLRLENKFLKGVTKKYIQINMRILINSRFSLIFTMLKRWGLKVFLKKLLPLVVILIPSYYLPKSFSHISKRKQ